MPVRPDPKDYDLSLLAKADARQATLERMRGKLASSSPVVLQRAEKRRSGARMSAFAWTWRISLTLLFLGANIYVLGFRDSPVRTAIKARTAPMLRAPIPSMPVDDQALYWTYALYDFDRLKQRFGAPSEAVIDAGAARRNLETLMPKISERTRFEIRKYLPRSRGRA